MTSFTLDNRVEFDYVIVGGGCAGAILAARLSEDPDTRVLLLEAGPASGGPWVRVPLGVAKVLGRSELLWSLDTGPEPGLDGARAGWVSGRLLGGSTAVNGMVFVRGAPERYDEWAAASGGAWSYAALEPHFRRLEDCRSLGLPHRGQDGPIGVSRVAADPISDAFLAACAELGCPTVEDYNDGLPVGASYLQLSVRRGLRETVAHRYLRGARQRSNLTVMTGAVAEHVDFDGQRAHAVSLRSQGRWMRAVALREVILCAGAVRSPQLLELSGIGSPRVLEAAGVPVRVPLHGVGENLQDHWMVRLTYESAVRGTVNDLLQSKVRMAAAALRYAVRRDGVLATPSLTATAFVSTESNGRPDMRVQIGLTSSRSRLVQAGENGLDDYPGFHIGAYPLYPVSRGSSHIDGPGVERAPHVVAGYLQAPQDRQITLRGLRWIRELAAAAPLSSLIRREVRPGPQVQDAAGLMAYAKAAGHTCWHPVGTCRMGHDDSSVVDDQLRVHGTQGLRVVDASVMPVLPSSNTQVPTMVLAERAAELIRYGATSA